MANIDSYFELMLKQGASDLHMSSNRCPMIRESGDMVALTDEILTSEMLQALLYEIIPDKNMVELQEIWDTDFAYEFSDKARFRGNAFLDRHGIGAVFRQIPTQIPTLEQLKLPAAARDFCFLSKGLVLVTGPTGSGKSTTLAAMINQINQTRSDHLITIEDPIEFVHKDNMCLINQREVHRHTKNFKNALRAALRQDPDIVLVGEMRDLETIEIAIETAETGHLVFGTLHTNTAPSTVDRIIDQFSADRQAQIRTMLASSLKGVIAQTLCKKKSGGRAAAFEILVVNQAVSSMIRESKTYQIASTIQTGKKYGMQLMTDHLAELVHQGTVDSLEAYIKAVDKEALISQFNALQIPFKIPSDKDMIPTVTSRKPITSAASFSPSSQDSPPSGEKKKIELPRKKSEVDVKDLKAALGKSLLKKRDTDRWKKPKSDS